MRTVANRLICALTLFLTFCGAAPIEKKAESGSPEAFKSPVSKSDRALFEEAAKQDTVNAYKEVLSKNSKGPYSELARKRIEQLEYGEAKFKESRQAYQKFLAQFPDSPLAASLKLDSVVLELLEVVEDKRPFLRLRSNTVDLARPVPEEEEDDATPKNEGFPSEGPIKITVLNKTGLNIRMLVAGDGVFVFDLGPKGKRDFSFFIESVIVLKDRKETLRPLGFMVNENDKGRTWEIWLAPDGKYRRKLQVIGKTE